MTIRMLVCWVLMCGFACVPPLKEVAAPVSVPGQFSRSARGRALPARWWRILQDPVLDRLEEQALRGSLTLRQAWDRLDQARALLQRAGAARYPTVDGELEAVGTHTPGEKRASVMVGLAASYELDLWGRISSAHDAARLDERSTREQLRAAAIGLTAEVALCWYQIVESHGQLELLQEQLRTGQQVLELVTFKFNQGQGSSADVLQQRQLLESLKGEGAQVTAQTKVLKHQLAVLLGRPPSKKVAPIVNRLPLVPPLPSAGVPARLIQRRPDARSAYFAVQVADRRLAVAIAERFPRLSLSASGSAGAAFGGAQLASWIANLAANLVAPLVDGGDRRAEVARTRAVAAEALDRYGQVILSALREVEDALAREEQHTKYLASLDRQLRLSASVIEQTRQGYLYGGEQYLRVLDALIRHQGLQRARLTAERALLAQRIALCRALAGGFDVPRSTNEVKQLSASASES